MDVSNHRLSQKRFLEVTPEMTLNLISCDQIKPKVIMMKIYTSVFALVMASAVVAQIPNASFENWSDGDPVGWMTTNGISPSVLQVSDAHAGSLAARLETYEMISMNFGSSLNSDPFPQTTFEGSLRGWYKANFVGGDRAIAAGYFESGGGEVLKAAIAMINSSTNVYTEFIGPTIDIAAGTPATARVAILIYPPGEDMTSQVSQGTWVQVDDLSWGSAVSVEEMDATGTVLETIYPNPTNGNPALVQFNMSSPGHVLLEVFDLTGKKVSTVLNQVMPTGHYRAEMNTTEFAAGVYFCRMVVDGQLVHTLRFVN